MKVENPTNHLMQHESIESIRSRMLSQLLAARQSSCPPGSISVSARNYHAVLATFMHQISVSRRGVELFGVPLLIDDDAADIAVNLL